MEPSLRLKDHAMQPQDIEQLLRTAPVGHLALARDGHPYVVPVNFAYQTNRVYIHGAENGMKMDFIEANPEVCFEVDEYLEIETGTTACNFGTSYRSVIMFGTAKLLTNPEEKTERLRLIVQKYAGPEHARNLRSNTVDSYLSSSHSRTAVIEITIDRMTGKQNLRSDIQEPLVSEAQSSDDEHR